MPLTPQISQLGLGFLRLFDPDLAPITTADSAREWAKIYTDWAVIGGVVEARAREALLATSLAIAFNPELAGGGLPLFTQALSSFWIGMTIPEQLGIVSAVIPTGSITSLQPPDSTPQQQAQGLAQVISTFTLSSVKVQVLPTPPGPIIPLL